ncbi:hypothetical protein [Microcoleus asticus]|nr:hypothetical protein [Microcoleus asticus]
MKNDSGELQASGFLYNRKLRFDWAKDSPTDNQNGIKANLAS